MIKKVEVSSSNLSSLDLSSDKPIFFVGIGGIGMSAIARYYLMKGYKVGGYDRVSSPITMDLTAAGADIIYEDKVSALPSLYNNSATYVIYTPAIPKSSAIMQHFSQIGIVPHKRSQALGEITSKSKALCVAGTHGKTSTSTLLAYLLATDASNQGHCGVNAFLGGLSLNSGSNLMLDELSPFTVIEADEYDRSFHTLHPYIAVVTSTSPDHLDIYHTAEAYTEAFEAFCKLIHPDGALILKYNTPLSASSYAHTRMYTYALNDNRADFYSDNVVYEDAKLYFDFHTPDAKSFKRLSLGVPIEVYVENATAAIAAAYLSGASEQEIRERLASFRGVHRRFEQVLSQPEGSVLIDDYAHHPEEIEASIHSVKALYPHKKLTVVFQPHLYSRTLDFYRAFAQALSNADNIILLPIYPAREEPIEGVSSQLILDALPCDASKTLCSKDRLISSLQNYSTDLVLMLGAGDIEFLVPEVKKYLLSKREG